MLALAMPSAAAQEAAGPSRVAIKGRSFVLPNLPPSQQAPVLPNGRVNWSQAYATQGMVYLLELTGDEKWARDIVDWGTIALAGRDAPHPADGRGYAWTDRSTTVLQPYVWAGYTGHVFAPLMEFSAYVLRDPKLRSRTYKGRTYREHALGFMREFTRALEVHSSELADDGRHAYFRFRRPVPVKNKRINGQPLPYNMNAALFSAMLHLAKAEEAAGRKEAAQRLSRSVARFVVYLNEAVLSRRPCGSRTCVTWQYSTYITRSEDVGHSNLVVRFLFDAHENRYRVSANDLIGIANTIDSLTAPDGSFRANLFDGSKIGGSRDSIYYVLLLTKYSAALRAKFQHTMNRTRTFAYWGSWLKAAN
ncbi:MAG: hypothetical protein ACRECO_12660 [Xanthobacteraceae bacterium]